MKPFTVILPNWTAPVTVKAFTTTVSDGVSEGNYHSLNLGEHVGDNPIHVAKNRQRLQQYVGESVRLCWLEQTHSDIVIDLIDYHGVVEADAATTEQKNTACVVMTADCLPVLLCNEAGTRVAALHCGWKGLYQNLIAKTIESYFADERVMAWLGPAIAAPSYEIDESLYQHFVKRDKAYQSAFTANRVGHYWFDLSEIAKQQLSVCGVARHLIFGGEFDTFTDARCFSYRQTPQTGRMATVIYLS